MRKRANLFLIVGAVLARQALFPFASVAAEGVDSQEQTVQAGEDRWVPSLTITSGVTIQVQRGSVDSVLFEDGSTTPIPLRGPTGREDTAVSPFFGGSLELMTPALSIPTRPRLFLSGEILPTFASNRSLAVQGIPECVRGPLQSDTICARDEDGSRRRPYSEEETNGVGSFTKAQVDTLVYGMTLGVSFPLQYGKRPIRIKPSVAWINYGVNAEGSVVDGACGSFFGLDQNGVPALVERCTASTPVPGGPTNPGFLRETILSSSASRRFNGVGPGLDVEMDTGRYGPLGVSLFLGVRAYFVPGDRRISFGTAESFEDMLGADTAEAQFEVEVESWMFRTHLGMRFQWLGNSE